MAVSAVGFYNIANQLVTIVYSAAYRVGQVLFPAIASLQGAGRREEAETVMVQFSWMLVAGILPAYLTLALFAHDVLQLWVGGEMADAAAPALQVMTAGFSFGCLFAVPNFFLLGIGASRWLSLSSAVQGTAAFSLSLLFVPRFGVVGAALAVALSTAAVYSSTLLLLWRRFLRPRVTASVYLAATFGPLLVIGIVAIPAWRLREGFAAWHPGWGGLIAVCAASYAGGWSLIQAANALLPGGRERWRQQCTVLHQALGRRLGVILSRRPADQVASP
jgi:O-antigen/teichoic acid export membrane protein